MKRSLLSLLTLLLLSPIANAQGNDPIAGFKKILNNNNLSLPDRIKYSRQGVALAHKLDKPADELDFLNKLQGAYYGSGNYVKQLEICFEGLELSQKTNNKLFTATFYYNINMAYAGGQEPKKAISYGLAGLKLAQEINYKDILGALSNNISRVYLGLKMADSAFYYMQLSYNYNKVNKPKKLGFAIVGLGDIENIRNHPAAALSYYRQSVKPFAEDHDEVNVAYAYYNIARLLKKSGLTDSAFYYAKEAYRLGLKTGDQEDIISSAETLSDLYEGRNDKESLRYFKIAAKAKESLHGLEQAKEIQTLTLKEQQRQQELAEKLEKEKEEAKQNLQLIIIAFFIPIFLFVVLLLSRTRTHRRVIDFMAVLSLLLLFEFITLLIHPQVEKITHHTPILELLILVALAALLVPLHHEATHWLKKKLSAHS